jgi:hypothetical protein
MEQFEVEVTIAKDAIDKANRACIEYIYKKVGLLSTQGKRGLSASLEFNDTPFPVVQFQNLTAKIKGVNVINNKVYLVRDNGDEYSIYYCQNLTTYNVAMAVLYQLEYQKK